MKFVFLFIVLCYVILTVYSLPAAHCLKKFRKATGPCMRNFQHYNLFDYLKKVGRNEISEVDFSYSVQSFCPHWLNNAVCNLDLHGIDAQCWNNPEIKTFINAYRFVVASTAYMCENSGDRFLAFIENNGVYCSENTPDEQQCSSALKNYLAPGDTNQLFTPDKICEYIRGEMDCSHYLTVCENEMVANISIGVLEHVKPIIGCEF